MQVLTTEEQRRKGMKSLLSRLREEGAPGSGEPEPGNEPNELSLGDLVNDAEEAGAANSAAEDPGLEGTGEAEEDDGTTISEFTPPGLDEQARRAQAENARKRRRPLMPPPGI